MKKLLNLCTIFFLTSVAIGQIDTSFWNNGRIKEIKQYKNVVDYTVMSYHPNGQFHYEGSVNLVSRRLDFIPEIYKSNNLKGQLTLIEGTGKHFTYFENGNIKEEFNYEKSNLYKNYVAYHINGRIKCTGSYGDSKGFYKNYKNGIWQFFDTSGVLYLELKYKNGHVKYWNYWDKGIQTLKEGYGWMAEFYENGNVKSKGEINDGRKWGIWNEYTPYNEVINSLEYLEQIDAITGQSFIKLTVRSSDTLDNENNSDGNVTRIQFNNDGTLQSREYYSSIKIDSTIYYYLDGKVFDIVYVNNSHNYSKKTYYPNGNLGYEFTNQKENRFYDWNGILTSIIIRNDLEEDPYWSVLISYYFYPNGKIKEQSVCKEKPIFNPNSGEETIESDCEYTFWDENGNENDEK